MRLAHNAAIEAGVALLATRCLFGHPSLGLFVGNVGARRLVLGLPRAAHQGHRASGP